MKSSCGIAPGAQWVKLLPGAVFFTAYVAPCSRPAGGSTRTRRNEDNGVLSGPLGDSSERDGREHLAREHLVNVPHGGVREAPPLIFTVFGKIRAGLRGADFLSLRLPFALASLGGGFLLAGRFQTLL